MEALVFFNVSEFTAEHFHLSSLPPLLPPPPVQVFWTALPWCSPVVMLWMPALWQPASVEWFPTCWIQVTPRASPVSDQCLLSPLSWYAVRISVIALARLLKRKICTRNTPVWNVLTCWQAEHVRMLLKTPVNSRKDGKGHKRVRKYNARDGLGNNKREKRKQKGFTNKCQGNCSCPEIQSGAESWQSSWQIGSTL